ncbi:MAG: DUF2189 domain-containing protein [Hyphomicrobiaceae bacterium]|nr:DUF2189 domain-containing protein [Hyphomicrobiaceae bacterium]
MSDTSFSPGMVTATEKPPVGALPRAKRGPVINRVTNEMITESLSAAMRDMQKAGVYSLFFGAFYAAAGLFMLALLTWFQVYYVIYPLAAGFALIAPFVAVGTYEVSRRLEVGEPLTWSGVLGSVAQQGGRELGWMAAVSVFSMIIWIDMAVILYAAFFGLKSITIVDLIDAMFTTPSGVAFFITGNIVGGMIAAAIFSITVVSYPMLLDRDVDFVTAMITSVKVVSRNPGPMFGWAIFIAFMITCALVPMFLGLIFVLPLLGHATWHLYRRAVGPDQTPPAA